MNRAFEEGPKLRKALGIDPGTHRMGYAVVECTSRGCRLHEMGALRLNGRWALARRFECIHRELSRLFETHRPQVVVIETPFYHHNVQTSLKLGRVIGLAMALAFAHGTEYCEISPAEVKKRITGNGRASKAMLERFLRQHFGADARYEANSADAVDALGIAYAYFTSDGRTPRRSVSWEAFIRAHPERIRR